METPRGRNNAEVRKLVNRSRSTIQYTIKCYKPEKRIENESRVSSNQIFYVGDEQYVLRQVKKDPFSSALKLPELPQGI